jgi:hypothetical protein
MEFAVVLQITATKCEEFMSKKKYEEAVCKYFGSPKSEVELKQRWKNGPFLCKYEDNIYEVSSYSDIVQLAKDTLSSADDAMMFPVWMWVEIIEDVHNDSDFYNRLLLDLTNKTQNDQEYVKRLAVLNTAINISKTVEDSVKGFWYTLDKCDVGFYGMAIIAASIIFGEEDLANEMVDNIISNGKDYLNQMKGGIFDSIIIDVYPEAENFFIYNVDPIQWEDKDSPVKKTILKNH